MYLRSLTLKGFKSFPDRTCLEFGRGVSVVVGPNGSGKSNITDAVLWALGEQSPLAVRGQSMQDVIFAGGHGVKGRNAAEVEVVIDNTDGRLESDFAEISISRRIDRSGEGVYRLNGARCRLVDVLEVLSDTGLGKEMHSVISQGRVESIVNSKPIDRTALIEEAAGLTKHRKRRHRAQLKLNRTQDNLDRALDVEREARSHLRPLKRQAEAAELHTRLERQSLEARAGLTADDLRIVRAELGVVTQAAEAARSTRDGIDTELAGVAHSREESERRLAEHGRERERLASRAFACRGAVDRISLRLESVERGTEILGARVERAERALTPLREQLEAESDPGAGRLGELEAELERLERERAARLDSELAGLESERAEAQRRIEELTEAGGAAGGELEAAEAAVAEARGRRHAATEFVELAARARGAVAERLEEARERARLARQDGGAEALAARLDVEPGYEAAVAAALGGLLRARVVSSLSEGAHAVAELGPEGGRALVRRAPAAESAAAPPLPGAERLVDRVRPAADIAGLVDALLGAAWIVDRIDDLPEGFRGIAVTRDGLAYESRLGEVRRLPLGAGGRDLAARNRLADLEAELARVEADVEHAREGSREADAGVKLAEDQREGAEARLRDVRREQQQVEEEERRLTWLVDQRRSHASGPDDARRAEVSAEIAAERRVAGRLEHERRERMARVEALERSLQQDRAVLPAAERLGVSLRAALAAAQSWRERFEQELSADEARSEGFAAELRELARREYDLQGRLREASETLTQEEVKAAQVRDREQLVVAEVAEIGRRLGIEDDAGPQPAELSAEERDELQARLDRLERRRERLGPVNPLAEREYEEAVAHVEELETQRTDLEAALAELRGLIRETDRRIRESFEQTFEAAARNFEDVIGRLFPGGSGKLRRVSTPRPQAVFAGEGPQGSDEEPAFGTEPATVVAADGEEAAIEEPTPFDADVPGIEIEVTPAGKATKRLSLLSGGEKSLVALAFMFAVFLARPCPFYILDEVEAALDDSNIDRFLQLVRAYSDRSQFIVITHQRRTMEAADVLYGVSMGNDGVSKVVSRKLEAREPTHESESRAA
ncbi:MAG TPA: AAA family ATPase [Solirubrobacterales bacterium]|nr:AAA family ATPase [Solirubrobacterales bacterium]